VEIYGGRPRRSYEYDAEICGGTCEDGLLTYVSANTIKGDLTPPTGDFTGVMMGQVVETNILNFSGWGSDADSGLYSGQLRALYGGAWHNLGNPFSNTFSYAWDLCAFENPIPDGVVSVGLRLYDWDGNWADYAGLKHFIKDFNCPQSPPACTPTAEQITLYEDLNYGGGCVVLSEGNYPNPQAIGELGDDDAASIRVGSSVQVTLYSDENYLGHSETLTHDDTNFSDNLIGIDALSSLKVAVDQEIQEYRSLMDPLLDLSFELDLIPLSWENGNNSNEFQVRYTLSGGSTLDLPWQSYPYHILGGLAVGDYSWQVRSRNQTNVESSWSQAASLEITSASSPPPSINAPYTDDMENSVSDWSSSGLWEIKADSAKSHSGTHSWWYQDDDGDYNNGLPNYGSLTSPPIYLPSADYFLRFWYRYETETKGIHWDQRWLQVSVDESAFINLYQFQDDPQIFETSSWLQSKVIDLSEYTGQKVQFRFQFASLDASMNDGQGWGIDDFSITSTSTVTCDNGDQGDLPEQAAEIVYSETDTIQAEICPGGDYDFYKFEGSVNDRIVIDIDAQSIESPLDSYLVLFDSDGHSILAEHDDEVYANNCDPLLAYSLPHDGWYYIKVRAWKHPSVGDNDYEYTIRVYEDNSDPIANLLIPSSNSFIPIEPFDITAQIIDAIDGISHVDFFWHDYDWVIPTWDQLGSDWEESDGWSITFDPSDLLERDGGAIQIQAYDKAGNMAVDGAWNIGVDLTPPSTDLQPLENEHESSALLLSWSGSDNASGIWYSNLQFRLDEGAWQSYPDKLYSLQNWFLGDPGHAYEFRIRGVDRAGNLENYPTNAQAGSVIPPANSLCSSPDSYDAGEGDNSASRAYIINPDGGYRYITIL
jgi:hypothetical protein